MPDKRRLRRRARLVLETEVGDFIRSPRRSGRGDLFGGHEALSTPTLFALVDVVDESSLLNLGARKTHLLTTLDAVWWIAKPLRLIHVKLIYIRRDDLFE
jgi:hypothetical protein